RPCNISTRCGKRPFRSTATPIRGGRRCRTAASQPAGKSDGDGTFGEAIDAARVSGVDDRGGPQSSPLPACGERSARTCAPGEGVGALFRESELQRGTLRIEERPPLPARGEREKSCGVWRRPRMMAGAVALLAALFVQWITPTLALDTVRLGKAVPNSFAFG